MAGEELLPTTLPKGRTAIRTADGQAGTIDDSQLSDALDNGATIVTPEQIQEAKKQAEYSTPGMEALAAAGGAASTVTLGLSDQAGAALGGDTYVNAQKYNPGFRLAGEVGGFLAPWGAEGLAERTGVEGLEALGGAPKLLSRAGEATEGGIKAGLEAISPAAQRGLATDMLSNAFAKGAGVGLEGSLYGLGQSISEDALDPEQNDLTAEKVFANMEKGALFAGGLGAIAGAAVPAGKRLARYLGVDAGLGEIAQKKAGEIAWRSAGGTQSMARGAEKFANGPAEVGKIWIDEAPSLVGESSFRDLTREKLAEAADKGMGKYGSELGGQLVKVDEVAAARDALPKAADLSAELQAKVRSMEGTIGTEPARMKIQGFINDMDRISGLTDATGEIINPDARVSYTQLRNFRQAADAAWAGNAVDPQLFGFKKDFHDIRGILEKRLETGAQEIAKSVGYDFLDAYRESKKKYQAFKLLQRATDVGMSREASNRVVSLTDTLAGHAGGLLGGIAGAVGGHAVGAVVGEGIGAALGGVGNHWARTRGNFLAADLLNQIGHLKSLAKVSNDTDMRILGAASSFVHSQEMTRASKPALMSHEEFRQVSGALQQAAQNPAALASRLTEMTRPMHDAAPQTAQAVSTKATAGVMFLASKVPAAHGDGNLLQPGRGARAVPSHLEIETFQRYLHAFEDPESVLTDMRAGRITREGVETVKTVYPNLFQQMQQEVMTSAADPKSPDLSYDKLVQLGVLFDLATTEFLQPDTFAQMQANFSTPAANAGPEPMPGPLPDTTKRPLKLETENLLSPAQASASIEAR